MRTNIDIDDELLAAVQKATGLKTKRAVVEEGLKALLRLHRQQDIIKLAGKVNWTGDLNESRKSRSFR